ncbi:hypothetical protein ACH4NC_32795 [Streptomyces sp. NPDC017201]|uniref:NucA/NucB deoxyribonuclease domain-containing protein n=1 Tax=unclassified Streptomyces TaxID=2593676 RepID=UPI0037963D2F
MQGTFEPQLAPALSKTLEVKPAEETCSPVAPGSPDQRAGVTEMCTAITPTRSQVPSVAGAHEVAAEQADGEVCAVSNPGRWKFDRLDNCLREMTVNFTLRGEQQEVLGTAILYVSSSATLNPRSDTWKENISVEFSQPWGQVQSLNVAADVSCTSSCVAIEKSPWVGAKKLVDNGVLATGSVAYSNVPAIDKVDLSTTKYHLYITHTGSTPTLPNVNWDNPHQVRCDSHLTDTGNINTGCVDGAVRQDPDLELPVSRYGAAAVTYGWAQWNLKDKWGLYSGSPLNRATNGPERRKFTCEEKSSDPFEKMPNSVVLDDSCDEFPFASTQQGGTDGALCAEIRAHLREDGKYEVYKAWDDRPITKQEPCVRGHVNLLENTTAGSAYSRYIQDWRLIEGDPFYVTVPDYFDMTVDAI